MSESTEVELYRPSVVYEGVVVEGPGYPILSKGDPTYGCCFDKQGRPIGFETLKSLETLQYKHVGRTAFSRFIVSTVWRGRNTRAVGRPDIFETQIRAYDDRHPDHGREWRYPTEALALEGHSALVREYEERSGERGVQLFPEEGQEYWDDVVLCGHCGKLLGPFSAGIDGASVCHTIWVDGQPTEAQTDCYKLVTVYGEELGSRMGKGD